MSDTMFPPKLAAALVAAQRNAKAVAKDAKNDHHRYRYASAEAIIDEGRAALGTAGLALVQCDSRVESRALPVLDATAGQVVIVSLTLLLVHDSGESHVWTREIVALDGKGRPIDKGIAGATTTSLAYAIRDLLLLPRDDEAAAMDRRDDRDYGEAPKPAKVEPAKVEPAKAEPARTPSDAPASGEQAAKPPTFAELVAAIRSGERVVVSHEGRTPEQLSVLDYVARAWACTTRDEVAKVASEVMDQATPLSDAARKAARDYIGEAWKAKSPSNGSPANGAPAGGQAAA